MREGADQRVNAGRADLRERVKRISDRPPHPRGSEVWRSGPTRELNRPRNGELIDQRLWAFDEYLPASKGLPDAVGEPFGIGALGIGGEGGFER
jgi:hypothetical protein